MVPGHGRNEENKLSNVRAHDPWSPHTTTTLIAEDGEGTDPNTPRQPTLPGRQPPPPVTQPDHTPPPEDGEQVRSRGDGLEDMLKTDLADLATTMGLPKYGTKDDLIDRIRTDRANSPK